MKDRAKAVIAFLQELHVLHGKSVLFFTSLLITPFFVPKYSSIHRYTLRGHGCGFLTTEFLPIAALLNFYVACYAPGSAPYSRQKLVRHKFRIRDRAKYILCPDNFKRLCHCWIIL